MNERGGDLSDRDWIRLKVYGLLQPFNAAGGAINDDRRLGSDINVDSLDLVEIVIDLESAYGIVIPDGAYEHSRTVGDLIAVAEAAVAQKDARIARLYAVRRMSMARQMSGA